MPINTSRSRPSINTPTTGGPNQALIDAWRSKHDHTPAAPATAPAAQQNTEDTMPDGHATVEDLLRQQLERRGEGQAAHEAQADSLAVALGAAIGGPLALNNDLALGRIAGGARTIVNGERL